MKKYLLLMIAALLAIVWSQEASRHRLKKELARQEQNAGALMADNKAYKFRDSLQGARVQALQLSVQELKKYRAEDAALLHDLRIKNKDLRDLVEAQATGYYTGIGQLRDSLQILKSKTGRDSVAHFSKIANFADEWHRLRLEIQNDSVAYDLQTHEEIQIVNHVKYRRFLGFLWRTRVKEITTEAISRNPYTKGLKVHSITMKKN